MNGLYCKTEKQFLSIFLVVQLNIYIPYFVQKRTFEL